MTYTIIEQGDGYTIAGDSEDHSTVTASQASREWMTYVRLGESCFGKKTLLNQTNVMSWKENFYGMIV